MIVFEKKKDLPPAPAEKTAAEAIRKVKAERSKKADTDGTRRRDKQTAEDNRLI
jgi:hypothetical protein